MDKWKGATVVLAVLLLISVSLNVLIYQVADEEISRLQNEVESLQKMTVPGVRFSYDGTGLIIKNDNIQNIYAESLGVYILKGGSEIFTKKQAFDLDIAVYGGYYRDDWDKLKLTPGAHYKCVYLDAHDGFRVVWKVNSGDPNDLKIRLFNETGFRVYKQVITNYEPGNPNSAAALLAVEVQYQLMGSTKNNAKEGAFVLGWDHGAGNYCVAFENWGSDPIVLNVTMVVEKRISVGSNQ